MNHDLLTISYPLSAERKNPKKFSTFQMGFAFNYQGIVSKTLSHRFKI